MLRLEPFPAWSMLRFWIGIETNHTKSELSIFEVANVLLRVEKSLMKILTRNVFYAIEIPLNIEREILACPLAGYFSPGCQLTRRLAPPLPPRISRDCVTDWTLGILTALCYSCRLVLLFTTVIDTYGTSNTHAVSRIFDVITSFFSGYMFGAGTTAHRHTRTVIRVP